MAIDKVGLAGGVGAPAARESGKQQFNQVFQGVKGPGSMPPIPVSAEGPSRALAGRVEVKSGARVDAAQPAREQQVARVLDKVVQAQQRLDHILALAESGRTFTAAELLALQAHVYAASQQIDMAGKVVEKATSGVKQVLQTQV